MPNLAETFRFDVAFSFAGPHRDKVRAVAELVAKRLGKERVFFDEWYEYEILGDDMDVLLQRFYHKQSLFVLADLSEDYAGRPWCQAEARAIRDLRFKIDPARDETQRLRLLNIRFGPGEVPGAFETTAYLDGVNKTAQQCADLILKRLDLLRQRLAQGQSAAPAAAPNPAPGSAAPPAWPSQPVAFKHGLADRTQREWPAVLLLLTADAAKRILMFHGPSGYSKSALLRAAEKYARVLRIPRAYVDFNDSTLLNVANVIAKLAADLSDVLPGLAADSTRWELSKALRALRQPVLLLFDTYEKAAETKELREWIETQLLAEAEECDQLRFIIGGQKVPEAAKARWEDRAESVELGRILDQRIWKEWVHAINPNVDEKHIEGIVLGADGVPGTISTFLETCARKLAQAP
jgi:hypothetical protein